MPDAASVEATKALLRPRTPGGANQGASSTSGSGGKDVRAAAAGDDSALPGVIATAFSPHDEVNANVFFEVGYAYALRRPVILLARRGTPLPFDVRSFRILFYEDSIGGKARLDESLKKYVNEILFGAVSHSVPASSR